MPFSRMLNDLHNAAPLVGPSLLSCDFAHVADEIRRLEQAGAKILHLDIMDGHFVPNLSIGIPVVEAIRRTTDLPLDVHLMLSEPARYIHAFRRAGADLLTFHIEAVPHPRPLLDEIRQMGAGAGISLNPGTPVSALDGCLDACDLVLTMSVEPGFGGQEFNPVTLEKLRLLREMAGDDMLLSVDGGIQHDTISPVARAGADLFVIGSALFKQKDYRKYIEEMTAIAVSAKNVHV